MKTISRSIQTVALVGGAVALAACGSGSSSSSTETTAAKVEVKKQESLDRLDKATQVIRDMQGKIPADVAKGTKCVLVFPSVVKVGVIIGGQGGSGFATCENANGWSAPAPMTIGGGTLGAQLGGSSSEVIALVKTERGMRALQTGNFRVGADASATAGPVGTGAGGSTGSTEGGDLVSYAHSKGLYAGANISGSTIKSDEEATSAMYGLKYGLKAMLEGNVPTPHDPAQGRFVAVVQAVFGTARAANVSLIQ